MQLLEPSELEQILRGFNPWWSGTQTSTPPFHRFAYYICRKYLEDSTLTRAILLSGPRRVGKSTILQQLAQDLVQATGAPQTVLYLSLDHPMLRLVRLKKILDLYHSSIQAEGNKFFLLLDEIQYSRDWDLELKQMVDRQPNYRILATGSAALEHRRNVAESGVGRWTTVPIPTLSFYEFMQIRGDQPLLATGKWGLTHLFDQNPQVLATIAADSRRLTPLFKEYLLVGGFPETVKQPNYALSQKLIREDVVDRVLKRDMTSLFDIRNTDALDRLFLYICKYSGTILAVNECARVLEVGAPTIRQYLEALEAANLVYKVRPFETGKNEILRARNKFYLVDAAIRNSVLLKGVSVVEDSLEMGGLVETAVLRHLIAFYYESLPRVGYWRDSKSGKEVDFVVQTGELIIPFEVKYRNDPKARTKSGLASFCAKHDVTRAYLITKNAEDLGVEIIPSSGTKLLRVPAPLFLYLLGATEERLKQPRTLGSKG